MRPALTLDRELSPAATVGWLARVAPDRENDLMGINRRRCHPATIPAVRVRCDTPCSWPSAPRQRGRSARPVADRVPGGRNSRPTLPGAQLVQPGRDERTRLRFSRISIARCADVIRSSASASGPLSPSVHRVTGARATGQRPCAQDLRQGGACSTAEFLWGGRLRTRTGDLGLVWQAWTDQAGTGAARASCRRSARTGGPRPGDSVTEAYWSFRALTGAVLAGEGAFSGEGAQGCGGFPERGK